jgi:hypothetical protein
MAVILNSTISQCAASLADRLPVRKALKPDDSVFQGVKIAAFEDWERNGVGRLLGVARRADNPIKSVQMAIQACLVSLAAQTINCWYPDNDAKVEGKFQGLYNMLRQAGTRFPVFLAMVSDMLSSVAPPIAGRWRALTKSNLDRLYDQSNPKTLSVVLNEVMSTQLSAVLTIAGYRNLPQQFSDGLSRDLALITVCLLELRCAVRAKTVSNELEAFLHPFGTPFDPTSMQDSFGSSCHGRMDVQVLCTTDLGLRRSEAKFIGVEQETEFVEDVVLMPKVALQLTI